MFAEPCISRHLDRDTEYALHLLDEGLDGCGGVGEGGHLRGHHVVLQGRARAAHAIGGGLRHQLKREQAVS